MQSPAVHPHPQPSKFTVTIVYNGTPKPLEANAHEQVTALLQRALHLFNVRDRPHVYALFTTGGAIIPDNVSVGDAGIGPGSELFLREKQVQGG